MKSAVFFVACAACSATVNTGGRSDTTDSPAWSIPDPAACAGPGYDEPVIVEERWENTEFEDWPVERYLQDDPMAPLVIYFHGSSGQAGQVLLTEPGREIDTLVRAGFSFLSTSSTDRQAEQWDTSSTSWSDNPDLARLDAMLNSLIDQGDITEETPILTDGFSNGGGMAALFSSAAKEAGWAVKACAMHSHAGEADVSIPQMWMVGEHDDGNIAEFSEQVYQAVTQNGGVTEWHKSLESPLDPMRFLRIPGYDEESSQAAFTEVVAFGILDEQGNRLIDVDTELESTITMYENNSTTLKDWEVSDQLRVTWTTHRVDSQWSEDVCNFFARALE